MKEPEGMVDFADQEKILVSDKGPFAGRSIASVSEGVSKNPESNASTTGVQEIPQQNVLDILASN